MKRLPKKQQMIIADLRPRFPEIAVRFASRRFLMLETHRAFSFEGAAVPVNPKNITRRSYLDTAKRYLEFIGIDEPFKTDFLDWCRAEIPREKAASRRRAQTKRDDAKDDLRELAEYFFREMRGRDLRRVLGPPGKTMTRITPQTAAKVTALLFEETYTRNMPMTEENLKDIFAEYEKEMAGVH